MPGIAGILTGQRNGTEAGAVRDMIRVMLHEPFYTHGFYEHRDSGVFVGHVSIQNDFSDCMPIWNEDRTLVMFVTGECYPDDSDLQALRSTGHALKPDDASYLVHLYEESPVRFFDTLNGWTNGLILDLRTKKAILYNDRAGIRRIYIHETPTALYFASEAKSLLKVLPALRAVDPRSAAEYFAYDCVLENRTWFPGVSLLPPGSAWEFDHGRIRKAAYFTPRDLEAQEPLDPVAFPEALAETFTRVLPRYFRGRVGLSLTGGLDTRMILAGASPEPGQLPCYTFAGSYRDTLDVRLAAKVARQAGQPHRILRLNDERFLADYPELLRQSILYTDGLEAVDLVDVIPMNRMAREVAPVRMTGKYGSQVLKQLSGFKPRLPEVELFAADFRPQLEAAKETGQSLERCHPLSAMLSQEIPWWWNGFVASESTQVSVRSPFLDFDLLKVLYRSPALTGESGARFQAGYIRQRAPALMRIPTNRGVGGSANPLVAYPTRWLFTLVNTADKIYIREELPSGMTHWLARVDRLLRPLHPDRLIMGYWDHRRYRVWFRDQLAGFLRETLLSPRSFSRPYWNRAYMERIVRDHIAGRGNYLRQIRKLLQVEMLHRVLIQD